jgi:hypothetical protein
VPTGEIPQLDQGLIEGVLIIDEHQAVFAICAVCLAKPVRISDRFQIPNVLRFCGSLERLFKTLIGASISCGNSIGRFDCGRVSLLEKDRLSSHILRMAKAIAILVGSWLIALAILITNHWAIIPGGPNSIAATIRLNRWTGSVEVCSVSAKSPTGSNAAGLQLTCDVQ